MRVFLCNEMNGLVMVALIVTDRIFQATVSSDGAGSYLSCALCALVKGAEHHIYTGATSRFEKLLEVLWSRRPHKTDLCDKSRVILCHKLCRNRIHILVTGEFW